MLDNLLMVRYLPILKNHNIRFFFHSVPFVPLGSYGTILVNEEEKHTWFMEIKWPILKDMFFHISDKNN